MTILEKIVDFANDVPTKRFEVRREEIDILEFREQVGGGFDTLPDELKERWMGDRDSTERSLESEGEIVEEGGSAKLSDHDLSDEDSEKDYTACSADYCGYFRHCRCCILVPLSLGIIPRRLNLIGPPGVQYIYGTLC